MLKSRKISVVISLHNSPLANKVIYGVLKQRPSKCIVIADNCNVETKSKIRTFDIKRVVKKP
jgi:ribosomal protein L30E